MWAIINSNYFNEYRNKLTSPEKAVEVIKSGDWVDYGMGLGQPISLDKALAARKDELKDIKIRGTLALRPLEIVKVDPTREIFTYSSWHFSAYERKLHDQGLCNYIPMIFRNKPYYYRNYLNTDVVMVAVTPMNKHGYFNLSLNNSANKAIIQKARTVIVEVNEKLPFALGGIEECIHISDVDYVVMGDNPELPTLPKPKTSNVDIKIAQFVVEEISNGSTIQLGIGSLPNAVGALIADSDLKDLGMHTEMLVDAYLDMNKKGKLTNKCKNIDKGRGVWTFCVGSQDLYDWVDNNPGLASYPVDYTNDPYVIGKNEKMVTINNCIEVDLYGQVSSESSGTRQISGTGGQLDFLNGGSLSKGGKNFICLNSTYQDKNGLHKSRIVPTLPMGGIVTDPRTQVQYLVTEWGKVNITGCSTWERAEMLISIAHPQFREELIQEAERMKIWRRSNRMV